MSVINKNIPSMPLLLIAKIFVLTFFIFTSGCKGVAVDIAPHKSVAATPSLNTNNGNGQILQTPRSVQENNSNPEPRNSNGVFPIPKKGTEYNPNPSSSNVLPPFKEKFSNSHEESDYYVRHGFDALNNKKYSDAEIKLLKAAKAEPENFDAYDALSMLYYETHRFDKSIECSTKAIEIARKTKRYQTLCPTTVLVRRGACYLNIKKFDEAIIDLDEVIKYSPGFAFAYYDRGRAYFVKNELDKSESYFKTAIKLDKENRFVQLSGDYLKQIEQIRGAKK